MTEPVAAPTSGAGPSLVERAVTCLGCGCACDDIEVTTFAGRIVSAQGACALGVAWFGDGSAPADAAVDGRRVSHAEALAAAAAGVRRARSPLIYMAPGLSCEAQRAAVALADVSRAVIDSPSSSTALASILAAQERGRATATLGELRNRADVVVLWDVDLASQPRFADRYAPNPVGLYLEGGRARRRVAAVTVTGPAWPGADVTFPVAPAEEVGVLTGLSALLGAGPVSPSAGPPAAAANGLADLVRQGQYTAFVVNGESSQGSAARADAVCRVSHALNGTSRGGIVVLRAGGNPGGAEAAMTAATGYPVAVDFGRGTPVYRPHDGSARDVLRHGRADLVVVLGDARLLPAEVAEPLQRTAAVVIGPEATTGPLRRAHVAVDTGRAGLHESGTALRQDEVPVRLRNLLPGRSSTRDVVLELVRAVTSGVGRARGARS